MLDVCCNSPHSADLGNADWLDWNITEIRKYTFSIMICSPWDIYAMQKLSACSDFQSAFCFRFGFFWLYCLFRFPEQKLIFDTGIKNISSDNTAHPFTFHIMNHMEHTFVLCLCIPVLDLVLFPRLCFCIIPATVDCRSPDLHLFLVYVFWFTT